MSAATELCVGVDGGGIMLRVRGFAASEASGSHKEVKWCREARYDGKGPGQRSHRLHYEYSPKLL
jgi:hypothetical protein